MHSCVLSCILLDFRDVDDVARFLRDRTDIRGAEIVLEFLVHHFKLRALPMGDVPFGLFPLKDRGDAYLAC